MNISEMPEISEPDIDRCMNKYLSEKTFSAGACMASAGERIFHRNIYGCPTFPPPLNRIGFDAVFDLASLTKTLATGVAVMHLASKNRIDLSAPISHAIPEFKDDRFESISIDMLLDHTSGFSACVPFWEYITSLESGLYASKKTCGTREAMKALRRQVGEMPLASPPGTTTVYSDVGFLALGWIVEAIVGKPLDVFVEQEIYKPLGLALCALIRDEDTGCGGYTTYFDQNFCGRQSYVSEGSWGSDDNQDLTAWVLWRPNAAPSCGSYTLRFRGKD